jgi:uncharacterized protein (TIGR02145 family)
MKLLRLSIVALSLSMVVACGKKDPDPKPPTLTGFSAGSGNVNASITITGANFDVTPAKNIVKFGDVQAEVTAATVTSLTVKVPNGSTKGKVSVQVGTFAPAVSNNDFITTSFIDSRDSQEYGQVYVGTTNSQLWMTRNLNYDAPSGDYCYQDNPAKCTTEKGKLYTWSATANVCPNGWRLPTETDFNTLITNLGGATAAKTALLPNGSSGLGVVYTGGRTSTGTYFSENAITLFWSSTEVNTTQAKGLYIATSDANVTINDADKVGGFCVRCIKN